MSSFGKIKDLPSVTFRGTWVMVTHLYLETTLRLGPRLRPNVDGQYKRLFDVIHFDAKPKTNSKSINTDYVIITQYMTSGIHLKDTTHCPKRLFTTHNYTLHERKIDKENMTAKGTRNTIQKN